MQRPAGNHDPANVAIGFRKARIGVDFDDPDAILGDVVRGEYLTEGSGKE
ncbi:hypothetical protein [Mesorhizobium sp. M1233]